MKYIFAPAIKTTKKKMKNKDVKSMKTARILFLSLMALVTFNFASAQEWPPASQGKMDTMQMRMAVIKGMPDSVARRNPLIFTERVSEDEYDLYVVNAYISTVRLFATISGTESAMGGKARAFAKVSLLDSEGKEVEVVTTGQGGQGSLDLSKLNIPDGIYRLRVNYGGKYTKNGTKPKSRTALQVFPATSGGRGGFPMMPAAIMR